MKIAILAGGVGTRLAEETEVKPKPMVEIGGRPILWHIMMHYSCYSFKHFVIALGYKGEAIKKLNIPESFNVLLRELNGLCLNIDLILQKPGGIAPVASEKPEKSKDKTKKD